MKTKIRLLAGVSLLALAVASCGDRSDRLDNEDNTVVSIDNVENEFVMPNEANEAGPANEQ
jgi:hypothetical protein